MRSRTELVTTTFVDSEEDQTESDDSEEDWRPDSNRNGKKRSARSSKSRRNKRKAQNSAAGILKPKMRKQSVGGGGGGGGGDVGVYDQVIKEEDIDSDDCLPVIDQKPLPRKICTEKNVPDKSGIFHLYLYKKDLGMDYKENSHLCLWRRDGSSLLQKYIRVKTINCDEFVFTSSSVYSSWDEKRRKDFAVIAVKCMEENNRRVIILDTTELAGLAEESLVRYSYTQPKEDCKDSEESSNDKTEESQGDDDEDDEQQRQIQEEEYLEADQHPILDEDDDEVEDDDDDDITYDDISDEGDSNEGSLESLSDIFENQD